MAMSMTGYGRYSLQIEDTSVTVEIRSVNHRFLDVSIKFPRSLMMYEEKMKKIIKSYFKRGRVELFLTLNGKNLVQKTLEADWELMDQYMKSMEEAKKRYQLTSEVPITVIPSIPEVFSVQESDQVPDQLEDVILKCTSNACEEVQKMRIQEGQFLVEDLRVHLKKMDKIVADLHNRREIVIHEYRQRIEERIGEHVKDTVSLDEARIHQEIVLLAEKGDITEEITRLSSHLCHFEEMLDKREPIGRKLDFITQEMLREANTIGSKSTDVKISEWTVHLKSEIEKLKEQVQNLE
ncbi:YicC/YloC family endoribonuclease [Oceanobacillus salinisoli]|uniref:YicC/YloC family endoribonuclease n=1 Tax=Oceanobacillus salinisoli TaxID=2678611 RepID=UPI0012E31C21|nr:YicC/YloC family endoribonuclease [Oceanobacillus salinisoli]